MEVLTIKDLYNQCKTQIERGNGDKKIMISNDDEGNGYHYLFFGMQEGKDFEYDDAFMMSVDENYVPIEDTIALDYHLTYAKLYDSGLYIQQETNRGDYFVDEEEDCEYSLEEGLLIVLDTIVTLEEYPEEIQYDLRKLYKERFGIFI